MTYVLGINSAYHESAACLIKDGKIIAAAEEERFNRIKHAKKSAVDNSDVLPVEAIKFCLKKAKIKMKDISYIGYSLNPKKRYGKNLRHSHPYQVTPNDFGTREGELIFHKKNLDVEAKIKELGFTGEFYFLNHHECHAASAFLISPYREAAILVVDGIGEFESTTLYHGKENKMKKLKEIDFPHSLGFLWEKISKYLGFDGYSAAKVMGLASYGNSNIYKNKFQSLVKIDQDGSFKINDYILMIRNKDFSALENLFGLKKRKSPVRAVNKRNKCYSDLAAALQELTENILVRLANYLKIQTGSNNLCIAGGVGLNCVANGVLMKKDLFKNIFVQPAANDAGTALGAAFIIQNQIKDQPRSYVFNSPYLGPEFSDLEIKQVLDNNELSYNQVNNVEAVTAKLIADGNIIAWFQGAMEIGPRALGNRSILADPRKKDVVTLINNKVKHREAFRPFCPSVLKEKVSDLFDLDNLHAPLSYMLAAVNIKKGTENIIPAVTHIDGTSRIQAVCEKLNPRYHKLISEFNNLTGVPVLLNTSFNNQEPIVCTPNDAIKTFQNTRIDYLVMGSFIVKRI